MSDTLAPLSFQDLVEVHDSLKDNPFFGQMKLPDFSKFMKEQTGSTAFDAGLQDSHIKRASLAIDRFLRPASEAAGQFAGAAAEKVGLGEYRPQIEAVGEGLPRMAAETLPVVAGAALMAAPEPLLTKAAGAALLGAGAASAGAKTYTETGSGFAGLISAGAQAAMPAAASLGRRLIGQPLINKFLTTPVAEKVGETVGTLINPLTKEVVNTSFNTMVNVPRFTGAGSGRLISEAAKLAEGGIESAASNLGVISMNEAAGQAESVAAGEGPYNPFTANHAIELAAGILPFAAIDAAMHLHGRLTKGFTSETMTENAAYLGQVREAQQLANTADAINRFRNTELRSKPQLQLPQTTFGPYEVPDVPREPQTKNLLGPGGEGSTYTPDFLRGRPMGPEVFPPDSLTGINLRLQEARKAVDDGILTPVEGAQRVENIQKVVEQAKAALSGSASPGDLIGSDPTSLAIKAIVGPESPLQTGVLTGFEGKVGGRVGIQALVDPTRIPDITKKAAEQGFGVVRVTQEGGKFVVNTEPHTKGMDSVFLWQRDKPQVPKVQATTRPAGMSPEQQTTLPSTSPYAAQIGAKDWFVKHFKSIGLSDSDTERYSDIAQHIAAAFSDVGYTRIGDLVAPKGKAELKGVSWGNTGSDLQNAFIGLVSKQRYGFKELDTFKAVHTLGHELWHGIQQDAESARLDPVKTFQYNKIAEMSAGMEPEERAEMFLHTASMMIPDKFRADKDFQGTLNGRADINAENHKEFMADMAGLFALGLTNPDRESQIKFIRDEMKFSSPLENQFARAMYVPMRDIVLATKEYMEVQRTSATTTVSEMKVTANLFTGLAKTEMYLESILKDQEFSRRAVQALQQIQKNDPAYYEQLRADASVGGPVSYTKLSTIRQKMWDKAHGSGDDQVYEDGVDVASKMLGLAKRREMEKELGVQPRFFEKWFYPFAQLSAAYPQLLGVHNIVRSYNAIANDYLTDLMAPFLTKPSKLGHITVDSEAHGLKKVASTPVEMDALNKVRLIANEVSKEEKRVLTPAEVEAALPAGLSAEARMRVTDLFRTLTENVYPKAAEIQVAAAAASVSHATASTLMGKNPALKWKDALAYGTGIRDLVIAQGDPTRAAESQQKASFLLQTVGPQALQSGMNVAKAMMEHVQKLDQMFKENPGYSPETRLGQYMVLWKRAGEKAWGSFASDDFSTAKARADKLRGEGVEKVVVKDKTDMAARTAGMDPDLVERWNAIRSAGEHAAVAELGESTDAIAQFRNVINKGEDTIATEVKARGLKQFLLPRKLAEGREDTNPVLGFLNYVSGVAHGLAKGYTREQAGLAFQDPELKQNPKLLDLGRKHLDNVINPTAKELSALKQMNFGYFMGFNVSNMLLEGSQGVLTFVPQITRDTGSISASYKAWGKAVGTVVQGLTSKDGKVADPELRTYLDRAVKEGRVDAGVMQEFNTLEENLIPNLRALASGDSKLSEAGELVKKPVYWYLHAARWLYSWAPRANSQVAFAAAWDVGRNTLRLDPEQAYQYAITTVDRTMFGGGKAGRPVEPFANTGKLQGVAGLMYSLQTYTFSTISMMARLAKESISNSDRLSPTEKVAARKAFGQMLVTQVALGGAMSLPFASGLVAVIDQLFPEAEVKRKLKEAVHNTLDGQDGLTSHLSDIALKGLPDAAGVDLSSRVGLSGVLGVNPYSGFEVGNLVGPVGSVVENVAKAARSASVGDFQQAARTILPTQYRNVLQLYQDEGQVKDAQGRLLYQPNDIEKLLLAGGFRPTAVSDRQEASQLINRADQVEAARLGRFHKDQADLLLQGNVGQVRSNLLNAQAENSLYDARAGAKRVVEMAQAATVPLDPTRSGVRSAGNTRLQVASSEGLPPGPTEQSLLLQRKSLERTLQIPGAGQLTPSEMAIARTVDYLMSMDRGLSRQAARLAAEHMLGRGLKPQL